MFESLPVTYKTFWTWCFFEEKIMMLTTNSIYFYISMNVVI